MSRREWDLVAQPYDALQRVLEPGVLRNTRQWIASRATGRTLEVAIGTGLTLPYYPPDVQLSALDLSPRMLAITRRRAEDARRTVALRTGDIQALPWGDASFDTVVCIFGLCAVRDDRLALAEITRVLRPGGAVLLADHVVSTRPWVRAVQTAMDTVRLPLPGEHWRRRPLPVLQDMGYTVEARDRFLAGVVERLVGRRPPTARASGGR